MEVEVEAGEDELAGALSRGTSDGHCHLLLENPAATHAKVFLAA